MEIEQSSRVGALLSDLIEEVFPKKLDPSISLKYKSYAGRILSSRLAGEGNEPEEIITSKIQDQALALANEAGANDNWGQKRANRVQECLLRLSKLKALRNRTSVLKLLSNLAGCQNEKSKPKAPLFGLTSNKMAVEIPYHHSASLQRSESRIAVKDSDEAKLEVLRKGIIRELIFTFQGIESSCIHLVKDKDMFELDPRVDLEKNEREIVLRLCEMGVLYHKIRSFLEHQQTQITGLTTQSLCYAIREELNEYYRFIATMENMRDGNGLSFKSLYLWTLDPMDCLKWLLILCDICKNLRGGQILSALFSYSSHGCPEIQHLVNRLLTKALAPFMNFLKNWVYSGELVDPMGEFFIELSKKNPTLDRLWAEKYKLNPAMVPSFIPMSTAEQILMAGKSKAFLRKFSTGPQWYLTVDFIKVENLISFRFMEGLKFRAMENWVQAASYACNIKLKEVIIKDYDFFEHCKMIKNFLLHGKGDFINALIGSMQEILDTAASSIFRHNLISKLESTKTQMNFSGYKKEYIERVGIYLFPQSIGYLGRDIFSLNYEMDAPLTTVFEAETMHCYFLFFNLMWKVKHLIICLNSQTNMYKQMVAKNTYGEGLLEKKLAFNNAIRHQMLHFLNTFQSYILLEVVEGEWSEFISSIKSAECLDDIIYRHRDYVARIMDKSLLKDKSSPLYLELTKLLECVTTYVKTQASIMTNLQDRDEEFSRNMDEEMSRSNDDESSGNVDFLREQHRKSVREENRELFRRKYQLIVGLSKNFRDGLESFLEHLEKDQKMKTLSFRLDFNEYYKINRTLRWETSSRVPPMSRTTTRSRMDIEKGPTNPPSDE